MKGTYIFLSLIVSMILIAALASYVRYVHSKLFTIMADVPCEITEPGECFRDDTAVDASPAPYKKVYVRAADAPVCLEEHTCAHFSCATIASCRVVFCSPDTLTEGEACVTASPTVSPEPIPTR